MMITTVINKSVGSADELKGEQGRKEIGNERDLDSRK